VRAYAPDGTLVGTIITGMQPANLTFGGKDGKTLFITARSHVYRLPVLVGPASAGTKK